MGVEYGIIYLFIYLFFFNGLLPQGCPLSFSLYHLYKKEIKEEIEGFRKCFKWYRRWCSRAVAGLVQP